MLYRLDIYGLLPTTVPVTFFTPDITVSSWSKRISAPGSLVFSIRSDDPRATPANLKMKRRVKLYRKNRTSAGYTACWTGYIDAVNEDGPQIEVVCAGMLKFFERRFADEGQAFTGQGTTEAFGLLTAANAEEDTGVTAGTGGVTTANAVNATGKRDTLKAWELLAQADGGEFEINEEWELNFVPLLGSDKSGTVNLIYRKDGTPGTNCRSIQIGEDGEPMANKVYATSSVGGLTYTAEDLTSQGEYGILIEHKTFNEAQDQDALEALADAYISQVGNPLTDFRITPETEIRVFNPITGEREVAGIGYGDVVVGDLVNVIIIRQNQSTEETKRIVEITVSVSETGEEELSFTLSRAGVHVSASYLNANRVSELAKRIQTVESLL